MEVDAVDENEDIPHITTLNFSAKQKHHLVTTGVQNNKLAQLFIKDIIKAKKYVKEHVTEDKFYFEVFGIVFKKVHLRATIVAIEHMDMKLMFTVDDGTASVRCFIEECKALEKHKEYIEETLRKISKMKDKDSIINQASIALLQGLQNRIKDFPSPKELQLGDVIEFKGLLNVYKEHYYIFIDEVRRDASNDVQHDIDYCKNVLEYYRLKHFI